MLRQATTEQGYVLQAEMWELLTAVIKIIVPSWPA